MSPDKSRCMQGPCATPETSSCFPPGPPCRPYRWVQRPRGPTSRACQISTAVYSRPRFQGSDCNMGTEYSVLRTNKSRGRSDLNPHAHSHIYVFAPLSGRPSRSNCLCKFSYLLLDGCSTQASTEVSGSDVYRNLNRTMTHQN